MEKIPHQEYRDNLAEKLVEIRNSDETNDDFAKGKAAGYLDAKKETPEYINTKYTHQHKDMEENKNLHNKDVKEKDFESERQAFLKKTKEDMKLIESDLVIGNIVAKLTIKINDNIPAAPYRQKDFSIDPLHSFSSGNDRSLWYGITIQEETSGVIGSDEAELLYTNQSLLPETVKTVGLIEGTFFTLEYNLPTKKWIKISHSY
jgi:hypothetical protein